MDEYGDSDLATNSGYDPAFDGDDLQNFSDNEAWEDAQAEMESDEVDECDDEEQAYWDDLERDNLPPDNFGPENE